MAEISVALELDDKQYTQALKRAGQEGEKFAKETEQRLKKTESAFAGLGKVIAGLGFSALITQSIQLGTRLSNLSDATQISIGRIKGLQDAFANSGGTADKAADGISDLIKNIGEAAGGSNELIASFQKVGVSLTDLQNLSEQDILRKVIAGLAKIPDSATRSAVGMKLMGESIKGVDLANVNDSFDKFSIKAANLDKSAKSAAAAQQALSNAFNDVQVGVLAGLEPLTKSIAQLAKNTEGIATFVEYAVKIGAVVATFFALGKAVQLAVGAFKFLSAAVATAGGPVQLITNGFRNFQLILGQLNQLGGPVVGLFKVLKANILDIAYWFGRAIPIVGALGTAFWAFGDKIKNAYAALKEFFGFGNMDDSYLKKEEARARAVQEQTEARQRLLKVLVDEKAALESQLTAYNAANAAVLKKLQSETELIGKSEEYKKKVQELNQAESSYLTEVSKLREQYNKAASPEQKEQITAAEARLTEEYNKQRAAIEEAVAAQEGKVRINNLERFSIDSLIQGNAEIQRIQDQIAKVTMPALERAYYDVEAAAKASAEAAIAAEEIRRGLAPGSMAEAERIQYYEAAAIRVRELQAATYELAKAESAREAGLAIARERLQIENDIRRVQDEMATMSMSEIEKKEYDIKRAAEERARAYIAAEEARTGIKMSSSDKDKIIKEYIAGTEELIQATKKSYDQSKMWSTGWKQAMNDYVRAASNGAQRAKDVFGKSMKGMEDLLVNFARTGKFEWKQFVASMVEELLRAQIQMLFAKLFMGAEDAKEQGKKTLGSIAAGAGAAAGSTAEEGAVEGAKTFWETVTDIAKTAWEGVSSVFTSIGEMLYSAWETVASIMSSGASFIGSVFESIGTGLGSIGEWVIGIFGQAGQFVSQMLTAGGEWVFNAFQNVGGLMDTAGNMLYNIFGGVGDFIASGGQFILNTLGDVGSMIYSAGGFVTDMLSAIGSDLGSVGSSLISVLGDVISSIGSMMGSGGGGGGWVGTAISLVGSLFGGFFADGGKLQSGKWGIVGEEGPEIIKGPAEIIPLKPVNDSGTGEMSTSTAQAAPTATYVTYNINAVDAMSFKQLLAQDPGYLYGLTLVGAKSVPSRR